MPNLKRIIEVHCEKTGETVEAFVIGFVGEGYGGCWKKQQHGAVPKDKIGVVLSKDDLQLLDHELVLEETWGAKELNALCVWTNKSVLILSEYDGRPQVFVIPRNPIAFYPSMAPTYGNDDLSELD